MTLPNNFGFICDYLTVPINKTGSWGMMDNLLRRSWRPMALMSTPSIMMVPAAGSTSLNRATPKEDFPKKKKRFWGREHFIFEPNGYDMNFSYFIAIFLQSKFNTIKN